MQSLQHSNKLDEPLERSAEAIIEAVSAVQRTMRREVRRARPGEMSMQQFRALGVISHHPGISLSFLAQHLGLTTASASRLVDGLVRAGLVNRTDSSEDRRKLVLELTDKGVSAMESAKGAALGKLASMLAELSDVDRRAILKAMEILRRLVSRVEEQESGVGGAC
ncbi:MAG: MarR family winged helix-turn-helix transcriptional regulator [Armatimonadota bacterium]